MRRILRAAAGPALGCAWLVTSALACNAIVGVEDVRLKRDASVGDGGDVEPEGPLEDGGSPRPNVLEVALGAAHTCARRPEGTVRCWGDDTHGQTGTGGVDGGLLRTPMPVQSITDALAIAAGESHTCVARATGQVACWGLNLDGQLGNGQTNARSLAPVEVSSVDDAIAVAAGGDFSCAVRRGGAVACWGGGGSGQLGNGGTSTKASPVAVTNLSDALAIAAGTKHACAVRVGGRVACWGDGTSGQLGSGTPGVSRVPVSVSGLDGIVAISAGARSTCALKSTGNVYCWGANDLGQLGNGVANTVPNPSPVLVAGLSDAVALATGADHACAVRAGGGVACWGAGEAGQLGDGAVRSDPTTPTPSPVAVQGLAAASVVGAGGEHTCATTRAGGVACWGAHTRGQLGIPSAVSPQPAPVNVPGYP